MVKLLLQDPCTIFYIYSITIKRVSHVLCKRATRPASEVFAAGAEANVSSRRIASVSSLEHSTITSIKHVTLASPNLNGWEKVAEVIKEPIYGQHGMAPCPHVVPFKGMEKIWSCFLSWLSPTKSTN